MLNRIDGSMNLNTGPMPLSPPSLLRNFYQRYEKTILGWTMLLVFLALWELVPALGWVKPLFTSLPSRIFRAAQWLFAHGFWNDIRVSSIEFVMDLGGVSDPEALQRLDEQTGARNREIMQTTYQHHRAIQARCFHPTGKWEEFKPEAIEQSIVARFDQMVARYPTRLAVKMGAQQLTYTEFNRVVNQLAHAILATRPAGAEPVVFLLEQGIQAIELEALSMQETARVVTAYL